MRKIYLSALLLVCLCPALSSAQSVTLNIAPEKVVAEIDSKIYGHFLEHIYHSVNGGLWGELIWNRSFEQNALGQWMVSGNKIAQESMGTNVRLTFGDADWCDYEFTLQAKKTDGQEGFLILFRVKSEQDFYWCNLGGWGNTKHAIERFINDRGSRGVGPSVQGKIDRDKWYNIRVRCEGPKFHIWLDDDKVIEFTDDQDAHFTGCVGIGTWATQAVFRNLKVKSLDGSVLYEGLPENTAKSWQAYGSPEVYLDHTNPLNTRVSQRIVTGEQGGGLQQEGLCIRAGETYEGSVWLRGDAPGGMIVRLTGDSQQQMQTAIKAPSPDWQEHRFSLKPNWSNQNAALSIGAKAKGEVWIDQVSLMPTSWRKKGGFRPDLLKAIADLKPPIIRWPGGCFASSYQWKLGIGPQHKRLPHPREIWDDLDVYSFGTDEFIAMCRAVGAEPVIVVNIGSKYWNTDADTHDYTRDILDWIEYCNGSAETRWGKIRVANGHPKPYNVKFWEIDNETWHMPGSQYAEEVLRLAPLMKKADPSIKLLACGSGGSGSMSRSRHDGMPYNRTVVERCAHVLDYISIHHYENPDRFADGPRSYEVFFRELGDIIKSSKNPNLKIYVSEWNARSADWRTGLYCAGLLNAFERCSDTLTMGGPALFLRHTSATDWDNAFINFDNCTWFPAPNYVVMKLWNEHYASLRLEVAGDPGPLNAVATKSKDGKTLYCKVVNPTQDAIDLVLNVEPTFKIRQSRMQLVTADSLRARNTLDQPNRIRPVPAKVETGAKSVRCQLPPYSAAVVSITR